MMSTRQKVRLILQRDGVRVKPTRVCIDPNAMVSDLVARVHNQGDHLAKSVWDEKYVKLLGSVDLSEQFDTEASISVVGLTRKVGVAVEPDDVLVMTPHEIITLDGVEDTAAVKQEETDIDEAPRAFEEHQSNSNDSKAVATTTPTPRNVNSPKMEEPYEVKSRHFVEWQDGIHYPVKIERVVIDSKGTKYYVQFIGYPKCRHKWVTKDQLKCPSAALQRAFEKAKRTNEEVQQEEKKRKAIQDKKLRAKKAKKRKVDRERKETLIAQLHAAELQRHGARLSCNELPICQEEGKCITEPSENRIVYFARDDQTPRMIATEFNVPIDVVMYHNGKRIMHLKENSPLYPLTRILLPIDCKRSKE